MSALDNLIATNSAPQPASSLDALIAQNVAAPAAPASASTPPAAAPSPQAAAPAQAEWQVPSGFVMGLGDAIKGGVQSIVHGGAYLANKIAPDSQFTHDINAAVPQIDANIANQETAYQQARAAAQPQAPGIDWSRLGGNVVGAAPMAMAAPEVAGMGLVGRTALGAALGAQNAAFQPVTDNSKPYADQKLGQLETGAAVGAAAAPLTTAIGNIISGVGGAAQQRLAQAGVNMTPGQILGGAWARNEEKLTSVPILGDFIKNAQQRSVQSFNRATYNEALAPIGQTVANDIPAGSDAIAAVRNQIGHVYDSIEPRATFIPDQNFANDLAGIRANLAQNAPATLNQFDNIVNNQITEKAAANNGMLSGAQWGNTRSEINTLARNQTLGNATPDNRALADGLGQLNDAVNAGVARNSPPDVLQDLTRANAAWARYKQIEAAAGMAGASNNGNVFTAAQFANAVRRGSTSAQKATNSGLNGQLASDAQDVLGSKYPDSGTPGRAALALAGSALLGHMALPPEISIPATIGGVAAAVPYTALGQRIGQALLMNRPAGAGVVGQAIGNYGAPLSAALGAALANGANR